MDKQDATKAIIKRVEEVAIGIRENYRKSTFTCSRVKNHSSCNAVVYSGNKNQRGTLLIILKVIINLISLITNVTGLKVDYVISEKESFQRYCQEQFRAHIRHIHLLPALEIFRNRRYRLFR